ncbi:glycosyltransferase [Stieleria varia]|uniref:Undecaprenyl phosphate-alpha-4-amino-4-deoxy-L-arabinose arabinosyl transferase n=1 Tax=Stieleria varia TaxID=2528005 RepID=A0A5C6AJV9_9BACT|nr:glycosyltransferase [Stieleria varia]TWT98493.1 Undecaprenyl phosphate-alpha-4-amino-4-deoxy-L-arabinose arabinosyl transferase [Stieleria varia]
MQQPEQTTCREASSQQCVAGDSEAAISLILPAWNERECIVSAITEADEALREICADYEIIVVDDGSTDGMHELVTECSGDNPRVRLVRHEVNQGYGAAIRTGFSSATKDLVVFTDADCQFDLTELDRFVLLSKRYDVVCGYRIDRKDTALRCLYSKVYNQLVRILLRTEVRDVDCALKMFHREVAKDLEITGDGFLVNSELLVQAKQQGRSVVEVGVSHRPRTQGTSTVSIRHIPKVLMSLVRYWWNAVQFPAVATEAVSVEISQHASELQANQSRLASNSGYLQIGLLLVAAIFIFSNLGYPLIDRDETRFAEVSREMIATGNWVLPQLNFEAYYDKPPLVYWLCALSFSIFGTSEYSARLVPAMAALATVAATMFFGSRVLGRRVGLIAGVVLMLSVGFVFNSRYLLLDGVLTLLMMLSLCSAYEAIRGTKLKMSWWVLSSVFCGLAILTKGPVAIVLWLPPVFAFTWLTQSVTKPRWADYSIFAAVVTAVISPWLVAVSLQSPDFVYELFVRHNIERFTGQFHAEPIWYFIPVLLIAGHPWSFLTVPYSRFLFGHSEDVRRLRPSYVGFLMLWSVWCFAFFSVSRGKLPAYLLPAAPALALMIGHYLDLVLRSRSTEGQFWLARFWSARSATATTCLAAVGFVFFVMLYVGESSVSIYAWAMVWTALLVISVLLMGDRFQAKLAWGSTAGVAFLFSVMVMHQMVPAYSRSQTLLGETSPFAETFASQENAPIVTVDHDFSEVPFYLNRSNIVNFPYFGDSRLPEFVSQNDRCLLIIDNDVNVLALRRVLPRSARLTPLGERGMASVYEVRNPESVKRIARTPESVGGEVQR